MREISSIWGQKDWSEMPAAGPERPSLLLSTLLWVSQKEAELRGLSDQADSWLCSLFLIIFLFGPEKPKPISMSLISNCFFLRVKIRGSSLIPPKLVAVKLPIMDIRIPCQYKIYIPFPLIGLTMSSRIELFDWMRISISHSWNQGTSPQPTRWNHAPWRNRFWLIFKNQDRPTRV